MAIRRVIGANIQSLISLIGKEYFGIVMFATFIGIPASYYFTTVWLQNFAYHIIISPFWYLATIAFVLFLLLLTIALQVLKVTRDNPVNTLREE